MPVVLLHGLGADEHDLAGLAPAFPPNHSIFSVRAPLRYGDGFQWFEIDWESETLVANPGEIDSAASYVSQQLPSVPSVVLGFSQGGVIAQAVQRQFPEKVAGLILLSTWPLFHLLPFQSPVPVLIQHGELDPIVPVRAADLLADTWQGDQVQVQKYGMAHQITNDSLFDISQWFVRHFGDTDRRANVG